MTPAHGDDDRTGTSGINRRHLLKATGGGAIGIATMGEAVAAVGEAPSPTPHEFVFFGCGGVCTDTGGNHVVVHRDGEYTCERIEERSKRNNVTWTHDNTYCYTTDGDGEQSGGQIVGAIEENEYRGDEHVGDGCRLCLNPNQCAEQFLPDDPCDVVNELDECGPCMDGDGRDIIFCGDCEGATSASANRGNGNGNGNGNGGD